MNTILTSYQEQIDSKLDEMIALASDLSPDTVHWKPSEDAWSVQEVLSHVEEAIPYWLEEIQNVVNGSSTEWGRTMQDSKRLAAVTRAKDLSTSVLLEKVAQIKGSAQQLLQSITADDLQIEAPSKNPKFGTKPLTFIMDHFVVEHMETHNKQIQRILNQRG
ncbi:MAG: hypothetical protein K0R47_3409 [Brevibacillus sp.]|nr:hypothetical protein [Brevibacillus sp.]